MGARKISAQKGIDRITLTVYFALVIVGWLMLNATIHQSGDPYFSFDFSTSIGKQTIWVIISIIAFLSCLVIEWKFWSSLAFPIYIISLVLLFAVLLFGTEIKGAKSWFSFGFFSFQPSELAKFGTSLAIASYLSFYNTSLKEWRSIFIALGIIFVPILLILLQPDAGSALVFFSFFILLYKAGLSVIPYFLAFSVIITIILSLVFSPMIVLWGILLIVSIFLFLNLPYRYRWILAVLTFLVFIYIFWNHGFLFELIIALSILVLGLIAFIWRKTKKQFVILFIPILIIIAGFSFSAEYAFNNVLQPHQQDRINAWLQPSKCDPRGSLYNILQSKNAIGSGGFMGKGYLKGVMTKLNYVPEQATDFIFSTVGEEQGFVGGVSVIILFVILILRILSIAERSKHKFIRNYAYAIAGIIFMHFFVNIGMTMGIMPVIGIPLPFLSKGGSSLVIFSIMIGILLRMDLERYRRI